MTLKEAIKTMYEEKPKDVIKNLEKTVGAFYVITPLILMGDAATREFIDHCWYTRTLIKSSKLDLGPAKTILSAFCEGHADRWSRWYKWDEVPKVLLEGSKILQEAKNTEEIISTLDDIMQYINRFNFWLDAEIPWAAISSVGDYVIKSR